MDKSILLNMKEVNRYIVINRLINKQVIGEEARVMLNLKSLKQVYRIKKRVIKEGEKGVIHKNKGRQSNRKYTDKFITKVLKIYQEKYHDFKPTFATEKLLENHRIKVSSEWLRQLLIKHNLWKVKSRRKPKQRHTWRKRKANYGEMQQFDGSYHKWLEDRGEECCLLLAVDDATGEITKAKFDKHEGVIPVFNFWKEYAEEHGIPDSIYLDKFSTYKINHKSAEDNKDLMTQFQRAANQIGIRLITAHSPEAKGRVERMNATLQDRLVKELRLQKINTMEEANKFLTEKYIKKFNEKFAVAPRRKADLHQKLNKESKKKLSQIFSIQKTRKVQNDYTILFENQFFQLKEKQPITVYKKDTVIIEKHLNGEIKINLKGHYLKYTVLPERPKKIKNIPICALTNKVNRTSYWTPPKNHPWRKFTITPSQKYKQTKSQKQKQTQKSI